MGNLIKLLAVTLFIGAILFPISAFASSYSGARIAGEAAAPVRGWTISNVNYQLSNETSLLQSVTFDLDGPAKHVSVKLDPNSTQFYTCGNISGYHWQCNFPAGVQVSSMNEFRVVAVGN